MRRMKKRRRVEKAKVKTRQRKANQKHQGKHSQNEKNIYTTLVKCHE